MAREIKQWITINGIHVPIYEGQSKGQAVKGFLENASKFKDSKKKTLDSDKVRTEKKDDNKVKKPSDFLKRDAEKLKENPLIWAKEKWSDAYTKEVEDYIKESKSSQIDKDEKTKQDQIKKNEEQKKQLNGEKSSIDSKLSKDIEAARNGDLTVRNSYMDRLNDINAKIGSGRGSAKLVEEASQLREKINKINDAYKESDKYKKEHADWEAFQKEQAAKRAEREKARIIADVETLKDKEGLYNPKNIQEIVNKMDKYRDEHEKQSPHIKIGGKEYDTIPLMGDDGKPEGYSLIPQSGEGRSNPFLAKNGKVYDSSNAYTREKSGLDAENERVKAALREEKNKSNPAITGSGKAVDAAKEKKEVKEPKNFTYGKHAVDKANVDNEAEKLAKKLPQDKFAKETRRKYIQAVYETYVRELMPLGHTNAEGKQMVWGNDDKNEFYLQTNHINAALDGNLSGWYANEIKIDDYAPVEWRREVTKMIDTKFRKAYKTSYVYVPESFAKSHPNLTGGQLQKKYEAFLKKNRK